MVTNDLYNYGMNEEIITDLPKVKWKILDIEKAKEAKIRLMDINEETTFLEMNLANIPKGITIIDWIETLLDTGIIFCEKK